MSLAQALRCRPLKYRMNRMARHNSRSGAVLVGVGSQEADALRAKLLQSDVSHALAMPRRSFELAVGTAEPNAAADVPIPLHRRRQVPD